MSHHCASKVTMLSKPTAGHAQLIARKKIKSLNFRQCCPQKSFDLCCMRLDLQFELIHVAKRGDRDPEAMKIADFWLKDKKQIHKLFKVLGPRFEDTSKNFTQLLRVPGFHEERGRKMAFLEYAGNPYPPLTNEPQKNPDWLLNVLVDGAVGELNNSKALEEIEVVAASDRQYKDNLEGIQHVVDMMALAELKDGGSVKAMKNEGTPV